MPKTTRLGGGVAVTTAQVVMPAAVLGILAHPFALDRPVWWAMGLAVRGMLDISAWIEGFDRATVVLPAFGPGALGLAHSLRALGAQCTPRRAGPAPGGSELASVAQSQRNLAS